MTIIEDAVKRLEAARAAKRGKDAPEQRFGTVVSHPESPTPVAANGGPAAGFADRANDEATSDSPSAEQGAKSLRLEAVDAPGPASRDGAERRLIKIDQVALREAGLLPPEDEEHRLINEFRNIKRPIVAHALGRRATKIENGRLIMVASALAGEGKTFVCINLALSMARERDISVALVDADVAKPHISRLFGVEEEPGLLDLLENPGLDYRALVIETDVPGLSILPAGKYRPHATELLSSDRMEALLKAYRQDNVQRLVLFDSPPLLQTPEARVLASLVGQIALVVRANSTPRHVVMDAISAIGEEQAVNLILNQARYGSGEAYYGGYHGYGGYGYGREPQARDQTG